ncbi:CPBP family intramembrane glutamic endopeptidase [Tropicimonas sp.]|uniref:CPBP family intramembrane glutamic endopeptidase n=1 Tax=Tropicimonas sp. TaxID=2067044 RepID=UPI003A88F8CD
MRYDPLRYFSAPAAARCELWRTAAGVVLTFITGMALFQVLFALASNVIGAEATQRFVEATSQHADTPFAALFTLFSFGFFAVGLAMVVGFLNGRSFATLFGPWEAVVSDGLRVTLAIGALYLVLTVVLPLDHELVRNRAMPFGRWLVLLPVSLTALMVQVGTEEAMFRGYLQQQLAARFPRWPVWLIVPSLLFGLMHLSPDLAGSNAPYYVIWATAFGLVAADLTARTGSVGAALGFHLANNFSAILLVALPGPGSGLAFYSLPIAMDDPAIPAMLLPELMTTFCGWLAARLALKV